jgi:hypothetical protein
MLNPDYGGGESMANAANVLTEEASIGHKPDLRVEPDHYDGTRAGPTPCWTR